MAIAEDMTADFDVVEAELTYIVDDGLPSIRYVDWPEEAYNERIATYEPRLTRIMNGRVTGGPFTLSGHGFTLVDHHTKVRNFYDEDEVRRVYYPETAALIRAESGGARVYVFDHTIRTPMQDKHAGGWRRAPVRYVHNDYTETSAPQRIRDFLPDEAEDLLSRRFAIIQTWRSIAPRVESEPLALCDGKTIPVTGFIRNQRRYRDRTAETYHICHNPAHRWYYFPQMRRDEALVFKVFDTDPSAGVRFTAHTAFEDPTTPSDAAPRESIEMRALVFW
jgi:hypothetical protein